MDMPAPCFRDQAFDGIFTCASFLHVPPELVPATLQGFARMLTPGGVLFLHHVASSQGLTSYCVDDLLIKDNPAICFCHSEEAMSSLLEAAGLQVLARHKLQPQRYPSPCAERNSLVPYQMVAIKGQQLGPV